MKAHRIYLLQMSTKRMADFMYAVLICDAKITSTLTIGCSRFSRQQNAHNNARIMVEIAEKDLEKFEKMINQQGAIQPALNIN